MPIAIDKFRGAAAVAMLKHHAALKYVVISGVVILRQIGRRQVKRNTQFAGEGVRVCDLAAAGLAAPGNKFVDGHCTGV